MGVACFGRKTFYNFRIKSQSLEYDLHPVLFVTNLSLSFSLESKSLLWRLLLVHSTTVTFSLSTSQGSISPNSLL